ncbi:MAG: AmmeMemoRadiSam system radical SAM enzyme, partial [Candidatus Omnitrophica bacterium]|nr:AmmeMemoRadiSam system radical SAM enzyme [Candidatus Omnitrophota bacterium]
MLKKAVLWEKVESGKVRCGLCAHRCVIGQGKFGLCGMRENSGGELYTHAYGKVIAARPDPVEKKPFYHFLPGTEVYSVAAIGCNLRCAFCQNWTISFLSAEEKSHAGTMASPEKIVEEAEKASCAGISYTYTEPTVFFEFAYETAKIAKQRGLSNSFVTNGFMTEEAIEIISPYLDAANVDLKFFRDASYREICKGRLDPVLRSIRSLKKRGVWVEVTTLLIPGKNDSEEEIGDIASFLSETGSDIPWH